MSLRSLTPTSPNPQRPRRPDNPDGSTYFPNSKQWHLRSKVTTKENIWVSPVERAIPFPQRNAFNTGQPRQSVPVACQTPPERKQVQTRIYKTTTTTQTIGRNFELRDVPKGTGTIQISPPTVSSVKSTPMTSNADSSFTLDLGRNLGHESWGDAFVSASPSLDIISVYESQSQSEDEDELRPLPINLPPVPDLPPPLQNSATFNPRKPQTLEELEERGKRNASDSSVRSNEPLYPASYLQPPLARPTAAPTLKQTDRKISNGSGSPRTITHQKTMSQSRLLPLHLNQSPYLTVDKPVSDNRLAGRSFLAGVVTMHWVLFACCVAFPPLWIALAGGAFDDVLHVPSTSQHTLMTATELSNLKRIKTVKVLAAICGVVFCIACLVGFVTGLAI